MAGKAEKKDKQVPIVGGKKDDGKEIIGMTASKETNFSLWYQELVVKAELVEYYNEVSECASCSFSCVCACDPSTLLKTDHEPSTRSLASTFFGVRPPSAAKTIHGSHTNSNRWCSRRHVYLERHSQMVSGENRAYGRGRDKFPYVLVFQVSREGTFVVENHKNPTRLAQTGLFIVINY